LNNNPVKKGGGFKHLLFYLNIRKSLEN